MLGGSRQLQAVLALMLVAATLAVYWPVQHYDFLRFDDEVYVTKNLQVLQGLTRESLRYAFTTSDAGFWHPLTWLSLMADRHIFGANAGGYHWTNLLFHLANTLLLFFILLHMTALPWQSAFGAALFALHPLHVEFVVWIAARKDVLSTFFWMLSLGAYVLYAEGPRPTRYLLVFLFFILGLMAKPMVVTLPFVFLLLDYWPLKRLGNPSDKSQVTNHKSLSFLLLEKLPFLAAGLLVGLVTLAAEDKVGALIPLDTLPLALRMENAVISYLKYLLKTFWPAGLAVFYPCPDRIPWPRLAGASVVLLAFSLFSLKQARTRPYLIVGWLWYLGTLLPVSGLIQVGSHAMADRYTYLPLVGIFIILSWGIPELLPRGNRRRIILPLLGGSALSAMMIVTSRQLPYWQNTEALFRRTLAVTERNHLANSNLGLVLMDQGKVEAIAHYREALKWRPNYAIAHNNLGRALMIKGDYGQARAHFEEALHYEPDFEEARTNLLRLGGNYSGR